MVDVLRREGFEVEGFESGKDALKWLTDESADLLLLDLKLADLPAPQLIERLRERGRNFPFIIITGHGDERTAVEVMRQGAIDYVMKESGVIELLPSIVRRALNVVERERKLAEADRAIREREELLQHIIHTALDGFVRFDADWKIVEVNNALCRMLGYTTEEMKQMNLAEIETVISVEQRAQRMTELEARGFTHCSLRLKHSDGHQVEVEVSMRAHAGGYFAFVHDVSEQRRLEREVWQISETERQHFGRELHDGLGQQLTAIELMSYSLARELKPKSPALEKSANEIAALTRETIAQARRLAHGLAPVTLETDGLTAALNDLARTTAQTGVACKFQCEMPVRLQDLQTSTHLFRIAQEGVNNALKHARAKQILIRLTESEYGVQLVIEDNGSGLPPKHKAGMGLQVIQHRARLIGAHMHIHSSRGRGVRIVCSLPKQS
jgi:PAS domain S-box-containing protein